MYSSHSFICFLWPGSEAIYVAVIGILLVPARTLGLKEHIWCIESYVKITFGRSNLRDMSNSLVEIPRLECSCQSGVQLCTCMYDSVYKWWQAVSHATVSPNIGWTPGKQQLFTIFPSDNLFIRLSLLYISSAWIRPSDPKTKERIANIPNNNYSEDLKQCTLLDHCFALFQ